VFETLYERGLELVTSPRKNMKGQLMLSDKLLLRKRFIIETITDQLKTSRKELGPNGPGFAFVEHPSPESGELRCQPSGCLIAYTSQRSLRCGFLLT